MKLVSIKNMKKMFSSLLAVLMMMSMTVSALAADVTENGRIVIERAVKGQTYSIYRIFDLESYDASAGNYSYKVNSAWSGFVSQVTVKGVYVDVNDAGYVTWVEGADAAAFAKAALTYAKTADAEGNSKISPDQSAQASGTSVTFENLVLGYYLVDSTLGMLCSLDTTNPDVTIREKNVEPQVEKLVKEDSTGKFGAENSAEIGQTVEFQTTITAQAGAQNYILHDTMSDGLTFGNVTGITLLTAENTSSEVSEADYEIRAEELADGCTFEIVFGQSFCDTLGANDKIIVFYTAVLNDKAVIAGEGNPNEAKLSYSEVPGTETLPSITRTYTYEFDLVKTTVENKVLEGAKFRLYDSEKEGNEIPVVKVSEGVYRLAETGETGVEIEAGTAVIRGLDDATTYYLEETAAPTGYNKLNARAAITINKDAELKAAFDSDTKDLYVSGGVQVINQTGTELPSTGGIGTTIFYILGSLLAVGAVLIHFFRKHIHKNKIEKTR